MTPQHRRTIRNLLLRGHGECIVCKGSIDETDDLRIVLVDKERRRMNSMRLRHALCQVSKYRPVVDNVETLIELMIASPVKLCGECKKSWVGCELEELAVGERGGVKSVLHRVCP